MRVGYGRVSSRDQHLDIQEARLRACCEQVYLEKASGVSQGKRPQLQAMLDFIRTGDVVVVCKLDRLGRSILDLHAIAERIKGKGATLDVLDQPMDMETLTGQMLFGMLSLMAQFETSLRKERQREGILAAQAKGVHFGRTRMLTDMQVAELHQLRAEGVGVAALAKRYGMTRTSLYRYLAEPTPLTRESVA